MERMQAARGFPLVLGEDAGGPRHFVGGKPVHCGTDLILCAACGEASHDQWVRYEGKLYPGREAAWIFGTMAGWEFRRLVVGEMRFLWGPEEVER